jgi:hypothetical protein
MYTYAASNGHHTATNTALGASKHSTSCLLRTLFDGPVGQQHKHPHQGDSPTDFFESQPWRCVGRLRGCAGAVSSQRVYSEGPCWSSHCAASVTGLSLQSHLLKEALLGLFRFTAARAAKKQPSNCLATSTASEHAQRLIQGHGHRSQLMS